MQTTIDFTVHQYEPQSTQAHLNENRDRFNKQCKLVYDYMVEHGSINPIQALNDLPDTIDEDGNVKKNKVIRLSSRIHDLKKNGVNIDKKMVKIGETSIMKYWII